MPLFLHLGDLPATGRSVCWTLTQGTWDEGIWSDLSDDRRAEFVAAGYTADGATVYEPGLSVMALAWDCPDDATELEFDAAGSDRQSVAEWCAERPAWLVRGEEITRGFDGEPVISVTEVVGPAAGVTFDRRAGMIRVRQA